MRNDNLESSGNCYAILEALEEIATNGKLGSDGNARFVMRGVEDQKSA